MKNQHPMPPFSTARENDDFGATKKIKKHKLQKKIIICEIVVIVYNCT